MRSAVLYDIHGNLTALEAVLAEADAEGCRRLVVGGDLVLFGPDAAACVDRLRGYGDDLCAIKGNTDRYVIAGDGDAGHWAAQLGQERLHWLEALPQQLVLADDDALVVHATPRGDEELLTPDTPDTDLAEMLAGVEQRTLLCGHVHLQYRRLLDGQEVINPGSVGMPLDGDRRAAWAIIDQGQVTLRRSAYDVDAVVARLTEAAAPFTEMAVARLRHAVQRR
jgi:predicted phosphodiesterase